MKKETAPSYLSGFNEARDGFIRFFAQKNLVGLTVLELGCGDGERTELFYEFSRVIGVDVVNRVSGERKNKFVFVLADATRLPFKEDTFDGVVSFDVIEHLEEDKRFVYEAFRVCKQEGKLIIGTPNRLRLSNRLRALIGKKVVYPYTLGPGVVHLREYTCGQFVSLILSAGFLGECRNVWVGIVSRFDVGFGRVPKFLNPFVQYLLFLGDKPLKSDMPNSA
jgi:SAM-dependent methyltransferase